MSADDSLQRPAALTFKYIPVRGTADAIRLLIAEVNVRPELCAWLPAIQGLAVPRVLCAAGQGHGATNRLPREC